MGRLFRWFDLRRRVSGGSFIGDDLPQALDAVLSKGGYPILADAVDAKAAVFREHVDREVVQPVFVLAEHVGDCSSRPEGAIRLSYSITSSARARIDAGTVRPSASAVLRLTTSSNVVGCWTGRSAGLAPRP